MGEPWVSRTSIPTSIRLQRRLQRALLGFVQRFQPTVTLDDSMAAISESRDRRRFSANKIDYRCAPESQNSHGQRYDSEHAPSSASQLCISLTLSLHSPCTCTPSSGKGSSGHQAESDSPERKENGEYLEDREKEGSNPTTATNLSGL